MNKRKIATVLISLLAALLLWIYVVSSVAPETRGTVGGIPVTVEGVLALEENGLVITEQSTERISIELNTTRANFAKLNSENIRVTADASRIREAGEYDLTCTITFPDTVNANDIEILRKSSETAHIVVAKVDTRPMPVTLEWTGSVKEGYLFEAESVLIDPAQVVLTGPDYELDHVKKAVISYDISDLEQTVIETLPITLMDEDDNEVKLSELCTMNVTQSMLTLPIQRTKKLTLGVVLEPGGGVLPENASAECDPPTIQVKGSSAVLDELPDVFEVGTVSLSDVFDQNEYSFDLTLPAGVINMSGEDSVTVTVTVTGVQSKDYSVTNIEIRNEPQDYETEAAYRSVTVTVRGPSEQIRALKAEDIQVIVDLNGYTQTGSFTVPGIVMIEKYPDLGVVGSVEVAVNITEPEE